MSEAVSYEVTAARPAKHAVAARKGKTPAFPLLIFILVAAVSIMATMIAIGMERGILV